MNMTAWAFFWRISIEVVIIGNVLGVIISYYFSKYCKDPYHDIPLTIFIAMGIFVAPILETWLFQTIPISISKKLKLPLWIQIFSSLIPFACVHIYQGGLIGIVSGIIGGFYLSFSYATWKIKKSNNAFRITVGIHSIYNTIGILIGLIALRK